MTKDGEKYPMWMAHPHAQRSVPIESPPEPNRSGVFAKGNTVGTVEKLAPVTVNNEAEEEYYVSRGYAPAGKNTPWPTTAPLAQPENGGEFTEYPKWVGDVLCADAAAEQAAMAAHIHPTPADASRDMPKPAKKNRTAWTPERRAKMEAAKAAKKAQQASA